METPPAGLDWLFYTYFGVLVLALAWSISLSCLRLSSPGFVLLPALLLVHAFDNLSIALTLNSVSWSTPVLSVRYAMQSFSVPLQLLTCFELAYVVRKKRSSNFFCMTFDQGHRKKEGGCSSAIRYSVWFAAFFLVFVSTIGNAQHILSPSQAAFTDTARFSVKSLTPSRFNDGFSLSDFVDVVPEALGMVFTLYIGGSLWRYGSVHSMDVSASIINRWAGVALSAAGLVAAWCAQPADWPAPYAYNGCAVALGISLCVTARLIDHNLKQLDLLNESLHKDGEKAAQAEPEIVPPRFRASSKEMARSPSERLQTGHSRAKTAQALRASRSMVHLKPRRDEQHSPNAEQLPAAGAALRPLPQGPRPPGAFQGVNPMAARRTGGAEV